MVMEQVWPQAFVIDPEYQAETTGFVDSAEVVALSPMTVSYVIDPKATWSDGYPITEADFEYNWQQQLKASPVLATTGFLAGYRDIKSISASNGGKTVRVVFRSPYSDWEGLFSNLIPAHIAERAGWVSAFAGFRPKDLISGGPFIVSSMRKGRQVVLTCNPRYWGIPAHLERIVFRVERSVRASLAGLQDGRVSIAEITPSPRFDRALAYDETSSRALSVTTTPSPVLWQLVFNLNHPVVGDQSHAYGARACHGPGPARGGLDRPRRPSDCQRGRSSLCTRATRTSFLVLLRRSNTTGPGGQAVQVTRLDHDQHGRLRAYGDGSPLTLTVTGPKGNGVIDGLEQQLQAEWSSFGIALIIHNVPTKDLLKTTLPQGRYQLALAPYVMPAFPTWNAIIYTDLVLPMATSFLRISARTASVRAARGCGVCRRPWEPSQGRPHWE